MKNCRCKKPTSSISSKCVVCGGDTKLKYKKANRELQEMLDKVRKTKCKLCGYYMDSMCVNCIIADFCTNPKCKNHDVSDVDFGECTPSISISPKQKIGGEE